MNIKSHLFYFGVIPSSCRRCECGRCAINAVQIWLKPLKRKYIQTIFLRSIITVFSGKWYPGAGFGSRASVSSKSRETVKFNPYLSISTIAGRGKQPGTCFPDELPFSYLYHTDIQSEFGGWSKFEVIVLLIIRYSHYTYNGYDKSMNYFICSLD